ncbi:MAG: nucleotidyltransferase substrate binding protein [Deltaproteobacteria bacterium]|nr:nucleotidyltransferase substrate binding protein [Deltaproteobacteria bacterium]
MILLKSFNQALDEFEKALQQPAQQELIKAGCIQYFEFSFELAWKTIKELSEYYGILTVLSPMSALKEAFRQQWIDDEQIWLDMLKARNRMVHTYDAKSALDIYELLPLYFNKMNELAKTITKQFKE